MSMVNEVLNRWNEIYDVESQIDTARHQYEMLESYPADDMEKKHIKVILHQFHKLEEDFDAVYSRMEKIQMYDRKYVMKYGNPSDRIKQKREKIFKS